MEEMMSMNWTEYRKFHLSKVSNNTGSTPIHTFVCILFTVQAAVYLAIVNRTPKQDAVRDYLVMVLSMILAHTLFAEHIYLLNGIMFTTLAYEVWINKTEWDVPEIFSHKNDFPNMKLQAITTMRGLTYLITSFCILGVDFKDFPRYLAKTERFGYSLMDTGVGMFAVISGLVHKNINRHNYMDIYWSYYKTVIMLVLLGMARFTFINETEYQNNITEYGVHWNFYFTLIICKILSLILVYFFTNNCLLVNFIVMIVHECLLCFWLQDWVFRDTPRKDLIDANKEGIVSNLGYVAIYLYGVHLRQQLTAKVYRYQVLFRLMTESVSLWTLSYVANLYRPTSRLLANASYCIYVQAVAVSIATIIYFFEVWYQKKYKNIIFTVPKILQMVNDYGLWFFVISNLWTGFINVLLKTMLLPSRYIFIILNLYMMGVLLAPWTLNQRQTLLMLGNRR